MSRINLCREANQIDLIAYLQTLGFCPVRRIGQDYWYHSPFRNERTPSFKINQRLNCWYDFGEGAGGTVIDFGIRFFSCSVSSFLARLSLTATVATKDFTNTPRIPPDPAKPRMRLIAAHPLIDESLLAYLSIRKIPFAIAQQYCQEVAYTAHGQTFKAIGFPNDSGGFELRSPHFKGAMAPKSPTTLDGGMEQLIILEGFFDFLSYQSLFPQSTADQACFLILNSTALMKRCESFAKSFQQVELYLDQDQSGRRTTESMLAWGHQFVDKSASYAGYKDLNEYLMARS